MKPAHNFTDRTITFFARGRPWSVSSDSPGFEPLKALLIAGPEEGIEQETYIDSLVAIADTRAAIKAASNGKLVIDENDRLIFDGRELSGLWVDKIRAHKAAGLPFEPVFLALQDLMRNPTPQAIERLPIFLERTGSGFLPDGRCTAFKGVRSDYMDVHSCSFDNRVGQHLMMERAEVDPDPNATCSRGLHVGALDYVRENYGGSDRKVMFVAFWPRDVVAVPVDYHGSKMRVCAYEVLDEVDPAFYAEFLARNSISVRGYGTSANGWKDSDTGDVEDESEEDVAETISDFDNLQLGAWVHDDNNVVMVVAIQMTGEARDAVFVRDRDGGRYPVYREDFEGRAAAPPIHEQTYVGCWIQVSDFFLKDGWYQVADISGCDGSEPDDTPNEVEIGNDTIGVPNRCILAVADQDPTTIEA